MQRQTQQLLLQVLGKPCSDYFFNATIVLAKSYSAFTEFTTLGNASSYSKAVTSCQKLIDFTILSNCHFTIG